MNAADFDRQLLWRYRARPLGVHDGDTLTVLCDTGYHGRHEAHIRLAGFSAPELNEPGGIEAKFRLIDALPFADKGWPLRVVSLQRETVVSEVMSFARYVGDVYIVQPDGGLLDVKELL